MGKTKKQKKSVGTFKDNVLTLVNEGKHGDKFIYYAVYINPIDYINVSVEKRCIILSTLGHKKYLTVSSVISQHGVDIVNTADIKGTYRINCPKERKRFIQTHLFNAKYRTNQKNKPSLLTRENIRLLGGMAYFPDTKKTIQVLRTAIRLYNNCVSNSDSTYVTNYDKCLWLFYSIFSNVYSNAELLYIFSHQIKNSIETYYTKINHYDKLHGMSAEDIKEYLMHADMSIKLI